MINNNKVNLSEHKLLIVLLTCFIFISIVSADQVNVLTTDGGWTSDTVTSCDGINITSNTNFYIPNITKSATNDANNSYILLANGTSIANATFSGNTAIFLTDVFIPSGTPFSIFTGKDGTSVTSLYKIVTNPLGSTTYFSTRAKTTMDCVTLNMSLDQTGYTANIISIGVKDDPTYTILPRITLYNNNSFSSSSTINITANLNIVGLATNINWTNYTYYTWFQNGTLFNSTLTTITNINNTNVSKVIGNLIQDKYLWNVYGCYKNTTQGNCVFSVVNYSFSTDYTINNVIYNLNVSEGSTQNLKINFSLANDYYLSTVKLIYNGTSYDGTFTNQSGFLIGDRTISIPDYTSDSNIPFYWNITLSNGFSFNSSIYYQYVTTMAIDDCSTYNFVLYNFTILDEKTQVNLTSLTNTTIEVKLNLWDLQRQTSLLNYSKKFIDKNPAKICLNSNISTSNYSSDVVVKYFSEVNSTSAIEYYNILNSTVGTNNNYINISLYALNSTENTDFQLTFKDAYLSLAPNILFYIQREYVSEGIYKTVEVPKTDSNGQAILHLVRNDVRYNIIAVDSSGKIVATFNNVYSFCQDYTIGSCTINLNARSTEDKVYTYLDDVGISYSLSYSNSTDLISLTFISQDLLTRTVSIQTIRNSDFGNRTVCTGSLTSLSGTVTCNASEVKSTDRYLFVEIYVDGVLKTVETIDLEDVSFGFGTGGYFIAFLMLLFIFTLFLEDKQALLIALGFGWVVIIGFGLLKGKLFGLASGGVWLLVCIFILLFKLKKEETG